MRAPILMTLSILAVALTACVEDTPDAGSGGGGTSAPAQLAIFGDGYPNPGDPCRRAGESAYTNQFLDDAADLVACPPGTDAGLFTFTYAARQVAQVDGWSLFSIPRR